MLWHKEKILKTSTVQAIQKVDTTELVSLLNFAMSVPDTIAEDKEAENMLQDMYARAYSRIPKVTRKFAVTEVWRMAKRRRIEQANMDTLHEAAILHQARVLPLDIGPLQPFSSQAILYATSRSQTVLRQRYL